MFKVTMIKLSLTWTPMEICIRPCYKIWFSPETRHLCFKIYKIIINLPQAICICHLSKFEYLYYTNLQWFPFKIIVMAPRLVTVVIQNLSSHFHTFGDMNFKSF